LCLLACEARADSRGSIAQAPEQNLGVRDIGVFSDLDARVQIALPRSLDRARVHARLDQERALLVLYEGERPLKVYPLTAAEPVMLGSHELRLRPGDRAEVLPLLAADRIALAHGEAPPGDRDGDGIPDPLDVLIGAHKTALNAARYDGRYLPIAYPLGDVPRTIGVCTDVIVRALRNAGLDLQRALQEDIAKAPRAYPMVQRPNPSIDHRRVKSVLPYFSRHFEAQAGDALQPGDVVFMDTFPRRPGAEHVGIVSEELGTNRLPLIINNWTDGTVTRAMRLLPDVPITQSFRMPPHASASGPIAASVTQLLLVLADDWTSTRAELTRFERTPGAAWRAVGQPRPAVLGYAGLGWGDGLHGQGAPAGRKGPAKREGDGRSPAGVFELGMLRGYASMPPAGAKLPYEVSGPDQRCVDDPASPFYNRITATRAGSPFRSAERMKRDDDAYTLAIDVDHNRSPVTPGHGSCIFIHVWAAPDRPVTGCTGLALADVTQLARWLGPGAVMVALPREEYQALQELWSLPSCVGCAM
jgi:uncharacterized protein YijF (DUF1287 family)/L,D-peptidoglycan transpeptidase YkuD (ErfK/YbiS/YcfS/YnhG family)